MVEVAPENTGVKEAISRFISSKRNENLAESTLDKLKTIFEKQFPFRRSGAPSFD